MQRYLMDLYHICSNDATGAKNGSAPGITWSTNYATGAKNAPPPPNIKLTFSEYGHVAYQIKENEAFNNMLVNILLLYLPLTPGVGSKGYFVYKYAVLSGCLIHHRNYWLLTLTSTLYMICPMHPQSSYVQHVFSRKYSIWPWHQGHLKY